MLLPATGVFPAGADVLIQMEMKLSGLMELFRGVIVFP